MPSIIPLSLICFVLLSPSLCHNHGHSQNKHGHSHDHHGHSHDSHGHSHDHHGHSHDHGFNQDDFVNEYLGESDFEEHADQYHHDHAEPAHLKYSREANQAYVKVQKSSSSSAQMPSKSNKVLPPQFDENGYFAFMNKPTYRVWIYSLGSTLLISAAPFLILFLIPIGGSNQQPQNSPFLKVLLSFASGGLLGDALLHLIPHSLHAQQSKSGNDHSHSHSHQGGHSHSHDNSVGLYVLMGITTFLIIEKLVRIAKGDHEHGHSHGLAPAAKNPTPHSSDNESSQAEIDNVSASDTEVTGLRKRGVKEETTETEAKESVETVPEPNDIKVAGYLNLAADFAHNFTDGLAVGASFIAGNTVGFVTTLTVLVHEIPHEIGDFAILIQSGCTKRSAMLLQLLTAFGAILGCCVSLSTSDPNSIAQAAEASWVLPFTAGGFIYVATVSVIPELLENTGFWQSVKEIGALFIGIGLMVMIAQYE